MAYTTIGSSDFSAAYYGSDAVKEMWYGNIQLWPRAPMDFSISVPDDLVVGLYNLGGGVEHTIDWGDGSTTTSTDNYMEHTYTTEDEGLSMSVKVSGDLSSTTTPYISNGGDYDITSWGIGMVRSNSFTGFSPLNGDTVQNIPDSWEGLGSVTDFSTAFYSTGITSIPDSWIGLENVTDMGLAFYATSLLSIPNSWEGLENVIDFTGTFRSTPITTFPTTDYTPLANVENCGSMFRGCTNLTTDIYSLYLYLSTKAIPVVNNAYMFYGCTNATNYDLVPASWGGGGA